MQNRLTISEPADYLELARIGFGDESAEAAAAACAAQRGILPCIANPHGILPVDFALRRHRFALAAALGSAYPQAFFCPESGSQRLSYLAACPSPDLLRLAQSLLERYPDMLRPKFAELLMLCALCSNKPCALALLRAGADPSIEKSASAAFAFPQSFGISPAFAGWANSELDRIWMEKAFQCGKASETRRV